MSEHANDSLPRQALFVAECLAQIRQHHQLMRLAALPERRATQLPPSGAAGEHRVDGSRRIAAQALFEAELCARAAEEALAGLREQALARAIEQPQPVRLVEGEDRDVDLLHHRAQQRCRLERAQSLRAQRRREHVHLEQREAERVAVARAARARGEISLAQRSQHVRDRLQWANHALARREGEGEPAQDDEQRQRPADLRRRSRRTRGAGARCRFPPRPRGARARTRATRA